MKKLIVDCIVHAGCDGCPESELYVICGSDMRAWQIVRQLLIVSNLVTITGHYVKLTQKAQSLLSECLAESA